MRALHLHRLYTRLSRVFCPHTAILTYPYPLLAEQYAERWVTLREALCKPSRHVAWDNLFVRDTGLDMMGLVRAHPSMSLRWR